jgi:hypothetical protein
VLHDVQQKQLTQVAAAERLKVTDRQVRRMLLRVIASAAPILQPVALLYRLTQGKQRFPLECHTCFGPSECLWRKLSRDNRIVN